MFQNRMNKSWMRSVGIALPIAFCLLLLPAQYIPSSHNTVEVHPGDDLRALVNSHPSGTVFTLDAGTYRLESIVPKDGDAFTGEPGSVLNGAQLLTSFAQQGNTWTTSTQVQPQNQYRGKCDDDRPACIYPEDLFVDDSPLERVADVSQLAPGKWYLDYRQGKIYLADSPANHKIELSEVPHAFSGAARDVTIQGLTIEKYASVAGDAAVQAKNQFGPLGRDWVVQGNEIRLNHGVGIWAGPGMKVLHNRILHNGQMGLEGAGADILVEGNEIAFNNYAGYHYGWEAGGTKFVFTKNLVVRNNFSHDNRGPGLWTDIENTGTLFENNRTSRNQAAGIQHEVSYQAVIRNNIIDHDGYSPDPSRTNPWYGAGIVVAGSSDVEVYGNTVTDCMNGIVGRYPRRELSHKGTPYVLRNLYVHDNTITQQNGIAAGVVKQGGLSDEVFNSWGNRFVHNTYNLGNPAANCFEWMNLALSIAKWRSEFNES